MRPQNHPLIKRLQMARKKTGKLIKARFISIETQNAGRHHSPHFSWTDADEVFQHPSFFNAPPARFYPSLRSGPAFSSPLMSTYIEKERDSKSDPVLFWWTQGDSNP